MRAPASKSWCPAVSLKHSQGLTGLDALLFVSKPLSPESQLLQQPGPPGPLDVVNKTPNSPSCEHLPDPGCLAAAAAELSPTSTLGVGAVSSSLFRGFVSASGMSALRLVDGAGSGIVCRSWISVGRRDGGGSGGVGAEATSVMYGSIGASSSAGTKSSGCSGLGMYTRT
ncbi:hypothetical protein Tco_1274291 [Tanacetum coccineum]